MRVLVVGAGIIGSIYGWDEPDRDLIGFARLPSVVCQARGLPSGYPPHSRKFRRFHAQEFYRQPACSHLESSDHVRSSKQASIGWGR